MANTLHWNCFEPREDNVSADLSAILSLAPDTYAARFRRSAVKRAKLAGLQRNARALLERAAEGEAEQAAEGERR